MAAATPVATAGALANNECSQAMRHDDSGIGRGEHLEAPGGVHRDQPATGGSHGRVERIAGAESLPASLTGSVTRVE